MNFLLTQVLYEDPYKLVTLGRDVSRMCATTVDFFFAEEALAIVTTDENGVMSMYNYDPEGKWKSPNLGSWVDYHLKKHLTRTTADSC